jgi:hypothetical protein
MACTFQERAAELRKGSSLNEYRTCPHYARATRRGRVHWIVLKAGWLDCWLEGDEDLAELGLIAGEGWADSDAEAWAAAVAVAGTDQLYLNSAGVLQRVVSARAEKRRQQRWAARGPGAENAAAVQYVYSHRPSDYFRGQDPYPYRRWRILRETAKSWFISGDNYGEPINASGEPRQEGRVFVSRRGTSFRVAKAAFERSDTYKPIGSAYLADHTHVWLELAVLVAHVRGWAPQFSRSEAQDWRGVLGLPADQHLEPAQVKQAFRRRLLQVHPDHGGSREQLELVQAAYAEGRRLVEAG